MERHGNIPEQYRQRTVETMLMGQLYEIQPGEYYGGLEDVEEVVFITQLPQGGEVFAIDGRQEVVDYDGYQKHRNGIVLQLTAFLDEERNPREGIIADFRECRAKFQVMKKGEIDFTDQEEAWGELGTWAHLCSFDAVIINDENGRPVVWGDPAFEGEALCMAERIDKVKGDYEAGLKRRVGEQSTSRELGGKKKSKKGKKR